MSIISDIFAGGIAGILQPISAMFTKHEDVKLEMFKVDGKVDEGLLSAYKAQLAARRDLLVAQQAHFGGRAMQYLFVYPLGAWWASIIVYCMFSNYAAFEWMKPVKALPENLLPWGAMMVGFLFLGSKIDNWVRKT